MFFQDLLVAIQTVGYTF